MAYFRRKFPLSFSISPFFFNVFSSTMGHVEFPISRSEDGSYVTLLTEDQMSARLWCSADWTAENILKSATIPVGSAIMSALTAGYLFLNSKKKHYC